MDVESSDFAIVQFSYSINIKVKTIIIHPKYGNITKILQKYYICIKN